MGGACSRKRDQQTTEENVNVVVSRKYSKSGSSKWLGTSFSRASVDNKDGNLICPSLMELCIYKISEVRHSIKKLNPMMDLNQIINCNKDCTFMPSYRKLMSTVPFLCFQEISVSKFLMNWLYLSDLPRLILKHFKIVLCRYRADNVQHVGVCCLESVTIYSFCFWQDINLGEYPGVDDTWMDVVSSQGPSLLSADISGSDVTDSGLLNIKDCENVEALNLNFCDKISDVGLGCISGIVLL